MAIVAPILPVRDISSLIGANATAPQGAAVIPPGGEFSQILEAGLHAVDSKIAHADALIEAYAKGDAIPVHQVTLALGQARVAVELAVQIRTRLVEAYRDFMNMQL